jgi:hypothetical protein
MHNPYELVTIAIHERLKLGEQTPLLTNFVDEGLAKGGENGKKLGEPIGDGTPYDGSCNFGQAQLSPLMDLATNVSHLAIHNDLNLMDGKMARFSFCIVKSKLFMTTNFPKRGTKLSQGPMGCHHVITNHPKTTSQ